MAFISVPEPSLHWGPPRLRISHRSISWYSKPGLGLAFLVSLSDICRYCTNLFQVANFGSCCSTRGLGHRRLPLNSCFEKAKTRKIWSNVWQTGRNGPLDLLHSHLSYPMLAYYRSQHTNQSWLAALTAIMDVSALLSLASEKDLKRQAEFTFAAGRHALVHTASIFRMPPLRRHKDRLPQQEFSRLCSVLSAGYAPLPSERIAETELQKLRDMYEPYATALATYFLMDLPPWVPSELTADNWQIASWAV